MRPCRSRMTASAFCTAATSSGLHSTSMNTCFLSRPPLEVRQPQTMTRPFERGIASPEKIKRACVMAELRPLRGFGYIFWRPYSVTRAGLIAGGKIKLA